MSRMLARFRAAARAITGLSRGMMINFALNHMTCPKLSLDRLLAVAGRLGCVGVELRCDLDPSFFDANPPRQIAQKVADAGLRVIGLAEIYGFNDLTAQRYDAACRLMDLAVLCQAEAVILIPLNDCSAPDDAAPDEAKPLDDLHRSLEALGPELAARQLVGLVEPLGFATSSLRHKADVVDAIAALGPDAPFKLVHDTFHHYLSGDCSIFAAQTGLVHISGVPHGASLQSDAARALVGADDQLENIRQLIDLTAAGYEGTVSVEAFSHAVHTLSDPTPDLLRSLDFITRACAARAA